MSTQHPLIQLEKVEKSFGTTEGQKLLVLSNISFEMQENEILVLLGKSGAGKSTLLRLIAGLTKPTSGVIRYRDMTVKAPVRGISMVFQNFGLLPWLTVLENVELGLEALRTPKKIRRQKALKAIDTIGMDGFESAYPKELSGGMRQRVGFARALVVEPDLLLMDEPFSALDILTSENLRNDLLDLWLAKRTRTKGILCVTHNIEEAILMANRIFLFESDPGRIQQELQVDLPYPRDPESTEFRKYMDKIYTLMTEAERERLSKVKTKDLRMKYAEWTFMLPEVSVSELTGLLETMVSHEEDGKIDLRELAEALHLDVDNLFPLTEALDVLRFAKISTGELIFLEKGLVFAAADIQKRKLLFKEQLLKYIPLARHIRQVLDKTPHHQASERIFLEELLEFNTEEEAIKLLRIIIDWGRYAEIFAYDSDTGFLSLENP